DSNGSVGGTLTICTETTQRVLAERRTRSLHQLVGSVSVATDLKRLKSDALLVIEEARNDIPFALLCRSTQKGDDFRPLGYRGLSPECADKICHAMVGQLPQNS